MTSRRKFVAAALAGAVAAPTVALAQTMKWRMVTSWPKRLPGPGMSAERVAERIRALSGGRIDIAVYAAGEIVPAFERAGCRRQWRCRYRSHRLVLLAGQDAGGGILHNGAIRLDPGEHVAWIDAGGGQGLWDELYAPFGVKPFMGGNTGVCMGGWFRHEIEKPRRSARVEIALARARRRSLSPARGHAADYAAGGNPHQPAIRRLDGAEFVGPGDRHRARALSRGAVLLLSRLQ